MIRNLNTLKTLTLLGLALCTSQAGAAEIKGKFVYDGTPPEAAPVTDPKAASEFPGLKIVYENLVVDPTSKGIANIAVYVRNDVAATPEAEAAAAKEVVIDNKNGRFEPHITGVWSGKQKLMFKNSDPVSHNSNFAFAGVNPLLTPNGSQEIALAGSKTLPQELSCSIHPWMKSYLIVRENPYVAVTDKDGNFSLKNLPTGTELEVQFWQEKAGYLAAKPEWEKGRMTVTLTGDLDLGEIKVNPELFNK
ncbi:MAG: hypothetical protein JNL96_00455 [Planctomycetaceae bacterium]|nr:hypothetical protein [Planctomycetaceae bacterium]